MVSIGQGGGIAAFNYEFCHQAAPLHRGKWLIDPFVFFREALGQRRAPVPDTTTASGRQLYFSLVDSEGWQFPVEGRRHRQSEQIAADIIVRDVFETYSDLPMTLDLRDKDIASAGRHAQRSRELAQRALALPHVSRPGDRPVAWKVSRLDTAYDSISNLAPLTVGVAKRTFVTPTSSEQAYRSGPAGSALSYYSLRETLGRSDLPRRLKPYNINFQAAITSDRALVTLLRQHLDAARSSRLMPMSANDYAAVAEGFFTTTITEVRQDAWRISGRGGLQTMRFDETLGMRIDLDASQGVLGQTEHGGALYVALDSAVDTVTLVVESPSAASKARGTELIDSSWRLRKLLRQPESITFEAFGHGPGQFTWRSQIGSVHDVVVRRAGAPLWGGTASADTEGRLSFVVAPFAIEPVTIELRKVKP